MTQVQPLRSAFMRRKAIAHELGIDRHTLARIVKNDPDFPRFIAISPGVEVIEREAFLRWYQSKRIAALLPVAPSSTKPQRPAPQ